MTRLHRGAPRSSRVTAKAPLLQVQGAAHTDHAGADDGDRRLLRHGVRSMPPRIPPGAATRASPIQDPAHRRCAGCMRPELYSTSMAPGGAVGASDSHHLFAATLCFRSPEWMESRRPATGGELAFSPLCGGRGPCSGQREMDLRWTLYGFVRAFGRSTAVCAREPSRSRRHAGGRSTDGLHVSSRMVARLSSSQPFRSRQASASPRFANWCESGSGGADRQVLYKLDN